MVTDVTDTKVTKFELMPRNRNADTQARSKTATPD
jgi:hypothetical protein